MFNFKKAFISALIYLLAAAPAYASAPTDSPGMIRVHLGTAKAFKVSSPGSDFSILYGDGKKEKPGGEITVSLSKDGGIRFGEKSSDDMIKVSSSSYIYLNGRPYRGDMFFMRSDDGKSIWAINKLGIEEYLYGVVGSEMPASWNLEALKAQSIAARTYAAAKKKRPNNEAFDVFCTVKDQVYNGVEGESQPVIEAVSSTGGEILTYNGDIITAYFNSSCGGHTSSSVNVFSDEKIGYLTAKACPYCIPSKWTLTMTRKELSDVLRSKKVITGELYDVEIQTVDESGRAAKLKLTHSDGEKIVRGADLRLVIGPGKQRSTKYRLTRVPMTKQNKTALLTAVMKEKEKKEASSKALESKKAAEAVSEPANFEPIPVDPREFPEESIDTGEIKDPGAPAKPAAKPSPKPLKPSPAKPLKLPDVKVSASFTFTGEGWGHGVGMCQWGAGGMAKQGFDYKRILSNYYPGTKIEQMDF